MSGAEQERRHSVGRRAIDKEMYDMSKQAYDLAKDSMNRVSTHEQVCAQRYENTIDRLIKLERVLYGALFLLLTLKVVDWAGIFGPHVH
jgi:hypothetical protein